MVKTDDLAPFECSEDSTTATLSALRVIVSAANDLSLRVMERAIQMVVGNKEVSSRLHKGMRPYLHVAGFLSLVGREINKENITKVMVALGITPSKEMIDALLSTGVKSTLPYINTFYLLLANGNEINESNMAAVIKSLGMKPDHDRIKKVLALCKKWINSTRLSRQRI